MSANSKRMESVQIYRAILFMGIVAFHCNVPGAEMLWFGVPAFFVISAYFLTLNLQKNEQISLSSLLKKRFWRLCPPYWIVLLLAAALTFREGSSVMAIGRDLIEHILFVQIFVWMRRPGSLHFTGHTWTLALEIWMSLIWMIAFKVIRTHQGRVRFNICMLILAYLYRVVFCILLQHVEMLVYNPIFHVDSFAWRSLLAEMDIWEKKRGAGFLLIAGGVGIFALIAVMAKVNHVSLAEGYSLYGTSGNYLLNPVMCNIYGAIAIFSAGIFLWIIHNGGAAKGTAKAFLYCGNHSYTAYLLHYVLLGVVNYTLPMHAVFKTILVIGLSVLGAAMIDECVRKIKKARR